MFNILIADPPTIQIPNFINQPSMTKYSTAWKRLTAAIVDSIVLLPLTWVVGYVEQCDSTLIFIISSALLSVIYSAYFIVLHGLYGQTIGKRIAHIKVVDIEESDLIGIFRASIRESPFLIAELGTLFFLLIIPGLLGSFDLQKVKGNYDNIASLTAIIWLTIELISMMTNHKRRAVHDYLAKSVVIRTDSN
jgi:uncharacterized RDD family membrane protein YckC